MNILSRVTLFILALVLFTACSPKAAPTQYVFTGDNPYAPQPGDADMQRGNITVDSSSLNLTQSLPPQAMLNFAYFQPTPCFQLRVEVNGSDSQNRINVTGYAVAEKDKACTLMALATPLQASLNLGDFPSGHYSVWLNGSKVGEFDS